MLNEIFPVDFPTAILIFIASWLFWKYWTIPKNLPPGPWGIPFLGYIPFLRGKIHVQFRDLSRKYGDVFCLSMGSVNVVVLSSYNAIKEALVKQGDIFSARYTRLSSKEFQEIPGIVSNSGESWVEFRRFSLQTLKDFGFGRSILEPQLTEEVQRLIEVMKSFNGQPTNIAVWLRKSVTNVICTLINGHRMEYDNAILNELLALTKELIDNSGLSSFRFLIPPSMRWPILMQLLGKRKPMLLALKVNEILRNLIKKKEENHKRGNKDNFIDCWFTEGEKDKKSDLFNGKQLVAVIRDLFIAGSDTTTNTLTWGLLYMAQNPDIQEKVQFEIDEIIGKERAPSMTDQKNMPYTDATILELSRITTIVPLSVSHRNTTDTVLKGHFIPKDSLVIPNLWAVHNDPETFPEPDKFKPERFLNDKQQVIKMEEVIPFSLGKRQCMGELLARMELFLYFTTILQQFTIKKVEGVELNFDYSFAGVSVPVTQKLCAVPRY